MLAKSDTKLDLSLQSLAQNAPYRVHISHPKNLRAKPLQKSMIDATNAKN